LTPTKGMGTLVVFCNGSILDLNRVVNDKKVAINNIQNSLNPEKDSIFQVAVEESSKQIFLLATNSNVCIFIFTC